MSINNIDNVNVGNGKGDARATNENDKTDDFTSRSPIIIEIKTEQNESDSDDILENNVSAYSLSRNRKNSKTTSSLGSNNISIATIDENESDSSMIDSGSDDNEEFVNRNEGEYNLSTSGIVLVNKSLDQPSAMQSSILYPSSHDTIPNIGSIAVQNSSDITFGNKTFYQGPVTIKQFVYDKTKWKEAGSTTSHDNPGFVNSTVDLHKDKDDPITKDHPDEIKKTWKWTNKQGFAALAVAATIVFVLVTFTLIQKYGSNGQSEDNKVGDGDDSRLNKPIESTIGDDLIVTDTAGPLRIISRSEWIAQPESNPLTPLVLPSTRVVIAHTATENCSAQADCTFRVRLIQTYHIESRGWDDIGYNFLVGGDGAVYVGRGWNKQGAHTKGYNVKSICVAFIGTFNKVLPPKRQLDAAQKILEEGVKLKKLSKDYRLYGHRQLMGTESPGEALYKVIKTWPHWSEQIVPP